MTKANCFIRINMKPGDSLGHDALNNPQDIPSSFLSIYLFIWHIYSRQSTEYYMPGMRGSRNFHERGPMKMVILSHRRGGGPTPKKSRNYLFLGKIFKGSGYFAGPGKIAPRGYFAGPGKIRQNSL